MGDRKIVKFKKKLKPQTGLLEGNSSEKNPPKISMQSESKMTVDELVAVLKEFDTKDLWKIVEQAQSELKKREKAEPKSVKKGSMPKGVQPAQLRKNCEWVKFTLQHALTNGWESFTVSQNKTVDGKSVIEEVTMSESVMHEGAHVYADSVDDSNPSGTQIVHAQAMSLSKQRKDSGHESYAEFEEEFVEEEKEEVVVQPSTVVKMTAAEKKAISEEKKEQKRLEVEERKEARKRASEVKKAEKEEEKAAKKALREEEKEAKKLAKAKPATKSPIPAAALKTKVKEPVKSVKAVKAVKAVKEVTEEWTAPSNGMVRAWAYKGKNYLRNGENEVWLRGTDGGLGKWQGVYMEGEDCIDDSIEEPTFE